MKSFLKTLAASAVVGVCLTASATTFNIGLNPNDAWSGFMNVFDNPVLNPGTGPYPANLGPYIFGSSWGTADLRASFAAGPNTPLTLQCNTTGDPNPFWYVNGGAPGNPGNKIMDANMYVDNDSGHILNGQTVTFTGVVTANNLVGAVDALGNGWTAVAFVKDFASDYSSVVSSTVPLTPGAFSVTLNTINDLTRHVQYGFEVIGPDVWAGDPLTFNSIQVVPEPSSLVLLGLGSLGLVRALRRRN
jgi:hypothetical protein